MLRSVSSIRALNLHPSVIGLNPLDLAFSFDGEFEEKVSQFASETGGVV